MVLLFCIILLIYWAGGSSGLELKSPIKITGKLPVFNSLIFLMISLADSSRAVFPIWSKCVLKTQNSCLLFLFLNRPYVQTRTIAASQPLETVPGVGDS